MQFPRKRLRNWTKSIRSHLAGPFRGWRRWRATLGGLAGSAGLAWMASVALRPSARSREALAPEEIAEAGTQYVCADGHCVAYDVQGEGDTTLLFLHGFGSRLGSWARVRATLNARYRTVALDLWGFGASARPADLSPPDWTRQVFSVLDALAIDRAVIIGHSLGGRVALTCAAQAPERVPALALLACDWGQSQHGYLLARGMASSPVLPWLLGQMRGDARHVRRLMDVAYGSAFPITPALVDYHQQPLRVHGTADTFRSLCCAQPAHHDLSQTLAGVRCPSLLLWGADDRVIPVEWATPLLDRLPAAELAIVPGAGHNPQDESPVLVHEHLQRFLARVCEPVPHANCVR